MIIKTTERNFVKPTWKIKNQLKKEIDRYYDKRYYLTKIKRNGRYVWGMKMFRRARQIEYFKRRARWKK